jgi:hypothetical protein
MFGKVIVQDTDGLGDEILSGRLFLHSLSANILGALKQAWRHAYHQVALVSRQVGLLDRIDMGLCHIPNVDEPRYSVWTHLSGS